MTTLTSYLLGHPISHSKSPALYAAAYRALGLDWQYGLMDRETEADAWESILARDWLSLNVTTPWKRLAIQVANARNITPEARAAHGANLLVNCEDVLIADNVDGKGCAAFLRRSGFAFEGAQVVVCGTGPTARAIVLACAHEGVAHVTLLGRDSARAAESLVTVTDALWNQPPIAGELASGAYSETAGRAAIEAAGLVIDATTLGMNPGDPAPFDTELLHEGQTVLDTVYGHGETAFVAGARAAGCTAHDGFGMLVGQAVETMRVLERTTGAFAIPADLDLFAVMSE